MSARRATSETTAPGTKLSATIARFCSSLQRRRRSMPLITSTRAIAPSLAPVQTLSFALVLSPPASIPQGGPHRTGTDDPGREIFDVIRWFGERDKLFNVHFRNIRGRRLDFVETFPDEGDMDMARSLATYREVGYRYMLMPDHAPRIAGRDP